MLLVARPHRLDCTQRLRALESKFKDMENYQLEIKITHSAACVEREASAQLKLLVAFNKATLPSSDSVDSESNYQNTNNLILYCHHGKA